MNDTFVRDLSGEVVSPNKSGYNELTMDVFATIKTAAKMNTSYHTHEGVYEYMERILDKELGATITALPPLYTDYDRPVNIGKRCFIQQRCTFFGRGGTTISNDVSIGPEVNLITINHDPDPDNYSVTCGRPIVIEDKIRIGINSATPPGVRAGYRAMAGVGSVVTRDVPATTIVTGNPAWTIKKIETSE